MILRRLVEYADTRMELPPVMYGLTPIRWFIDLTQSGDLKGFILRDGSNKKGGILQVPTLRKTSGIRPRLLADNGEYVLGDYRRDNAASKVEKVIERHLAFIELSRLCARETDEPTLKAVTKFLDHWSFDPDMVPVDLSPSDIMTFRVEEVVPAVELRSVQNFWANYIAEGGAQKTKQNTGTCLVTGTYGPIAKRMPVPVKGLFRIGGKAENSLVTANEDAFESYGLENSFTSPISREAGEKFGKALNHLLNDDKSSVFVGPSAYVFWTREESTFDPFVMIRPEPESVKLLLESPFSGNKRTDVEVNDFYALALSASGARTVVRDWLETTVPDAQENLKRWFRAQMVVDSRGEGGTPLGLFPLAAGAYRDANKEMTPQVPAALVRAAIKGGRVPEDLLARAVRRNRAEGDVIRQRAALMKLVLIYGGEAMAETLEKLNPRVEDPAYHCGRLLAQLEELQKAAIPGVKATIVDRYYGAASSTPASVFGTLMRNHNAHISKIRKERPGVGVAIQDQIGEITEKIGTFFPPTLTMRQQAVFALGFYHQRAHNRAEARAAKEARENR